MCRILLLCIAALVGVYPACGQDEVVSDTLDWRGYYPLEIGNIWEWTSYILVSYHAEDRREIVADTIINGRRYFVQISYSHRRDSNLGYDRTSRGKIFLRYDTTTSRVVALSPENGEEWNYTCDLSTDFGAQTFCKEGEMYVAGGYRINHPYLLIGEDTVMTGAEKVFYNLGGGTHYFHGIGRLPGIGDGSAGIIKFVYLRLSGKEYGESVVALGFEDAPLPLQQKIAVFPNPVEDRLTIDIEGARGTASIVIYDILGRKVETVLRCGWPRCFIDTVGFSPGVYYARVRSADNTIAFAPFVVD